MNSFTETADVEGPSSVEVVINAPSGAWLLKISPDGDGGALLGMRFAGSHAVMKTSVDQLEDLSAELAKLAAEIRA